MRCHCAGLWQTQHTHASYPGTRKENETRKETKWKKKKNETKYEVKKNQQKERKGNVKGDKARANMQELKCNDNKEWKERLPRRVLDNNPGHNRRRAPPSARCRVPSPRGDATGRTVKKKEKKTNVIDETKKRERTRKTFHTSIPRIKRLQKGKKRVESLSDWR